MSTIYYPRPDTIGEVPLTGHVVIEASAGTGKTYTIEHLVIDRLIRTQCALDTILVVTFTEKATSELRQRIRELIERVLRAPAGQEGPNTWTVDDDAQRRLEQALFRFDHAPISTIHGFCNRILVEMAFDAGQLFEQAFVDSARAFGRAWREILRTRLTTDPAHSQLLRRWLTEDRDLVQLERLLFQSHRQHYLEGTEPLRNELPAVLQRLAMTDRDVVVDAYEGAALQAKAVIKAVAAIDDLLAALADGPEPDEALRRLDALPVNDIIRPRRIAARTKPRFPDALVDEAQDFIAQVRRIGLLRALDGALERSIVDAFLPEITARLERHKRGEGQLDYDDLLDRVWLALEGPRGNDLANALRRRYTYALIDEFQDTDPRQWGIFQRIFVEGRTEHGLAVIGDPKQAIYGFRGADVYTYIRATEALEAQGAPKLALDVNFRSTQPMIDATNTILDQTGRKPLFTGKIRYTDPVKCGRPSRRLLIDGVDAPPVVLWRYKPPPPRGGNRNVVPVYQLRNAYTRQLAETLRALLDHPPTLVDETGERLLCARDIFILVRTQREEREAAGALRKARVPYAFFKQDGLFQSDEARHVHSVLAAVADPRNRGRRLRAFATPFFGVPFSMLDRYRELPPSHPAIQRLWTWRQLLDEAHLATLFHHILHHSGLVERALFGADDERGITNYQHIFELLLEIGGRRRLSLPELVALLHRYIQRIESPDGMDSNIQRLPDERDAVQIMTIHKSKGLEAQVVCLYGGFSRRPPRTVSVVHEHDGQRRVLIGDAAHQTAADQLDQESHQEDERLLYVALTRAKVRLYLPFIDSSRAVEGSYGPLKERLLAMSATGFPSGFEQIEVPDIKPWEHVSTPAPDNAGPLDKWVPPTHLLTQPDDGSRFDKLRENHAALVVTSYTRLKESSNANTPVDAEEFKRDEPAELPVADRASQALPGGRHMGRCLHEAIEHLAFESFTETPDFERWRQRPDVLQAFEWAMRRNDIETRWLTLAQQTIYDTLTRPIPVENDKTVPALHPCRNVVELEFLYPLPEANHPLLERALTDKPRWTVGRGYVKGFIDFIFEYEGRIYFADWKSDVMASYRPAEIAPHVNDHYVIQAQLYTLGVVRWLNITDRQTYERRFGGLLYIFLRGMSQREAPDDGIYFQRPSWDDVLRYERDLITLEVE